MRRFLLFCALVIAVSASSYCVPTGCAGGACTCPPVFFFCDTTTDLNGVCTFTSTGVWLVVVIIVVLLALVAALIFLVCCCCCCRCKRGKETHVHVMAPQQIV